MSTGRVNAPTAVEAAWIREHAWTKAQRNTFAATPGFYLRCDCQSGKCGACERGQHDRCVHGPNGYAPFPGEEAVITDQHCMARSLPCRFEHPTPSATGAARTSAAMVWLADRRCVWRCPCNHPSAATPSPPRRDPAPVWQPALDLLGLPEEEHR